MRFRDAVAHPVYVNWRKLRFVVFLDDVGVDVFCTVNAGDPVNRAKDSFCHRVDVLLACLFLDGDIEHELSIEFSHIKVWQTTIRSASGGLSDYCAFIQLLISFFALNALPVLLTPAGTATTFVRAVFPMRSCGFATSSP